MINVVLLVAWILTGILAVNVLAPNRGTRWQLAPLGMVLGPMWIAIALEQRASPPAHAYAVVERPHVIDYRESERQRHIHGADAA